MECVSWRFSHLHLHMHMHMHTRFGLQDVAGRLRVKSKLVAMRFLFVLLHLLVTLAPCEVVIEVVDDLRSSLAAAQIGVPISLQLAEGRTFALAGAQLEVCAGCAVTLTSKGQGAIIDGGKTSRLFQVNATARLHLDRIHLFNGSSDGDGGAVRVAESGNVSIVNCVVLNCNAVGDGGCIYLSGAHAHLDNVTSIHSIAEYFANSGGTNACGKGGVVYGESSTINIGTLTAMSSRVGYSDGLKRLGEGGVVYGADSTINIGTLTATGSEAGKGGVICVEGGSAKIGTLNATDSRGWIYGGVLFGSGIGLIEVDTLIATESLVKNGGCCAAQGGVIGATHRLKMFNTCATSASGLANGNMEITIGTLTAVNTTTSGGVVHAGDGGKVSIGSLVAMKSKALRGHYSGSGGVLYAANKGRVTVGSLTANESAADEYGGVLYATGVGSVVEVGNLNVAKSSASYGGVLYAGSDGRVSVGSLTANESSARTDGGVVYAVYTGVAIIDSAAVAQSSAGGVGGVICAPASSLVQMSSLTAVRSSSNYGGVAFATTGAAIVLGTLSATESSAGSGGVLYGSYQGIFVVGSSKALGPSLLRYSSAKYSGSAIYLTRGSKLQATALTIQHTCSAQSKPIMYEDSRFGAASVLLARGLRLELDCDDPTSFTGTAIDGFADAFNLKCGPQAFESLEQGVGLINVCSQRAGTECNDVPVAPWSTSNATTPTCQCAAGFLPNRQSADASFAPYFGGDLDGCVRPVGLESLAHVSSMEVVVALTKDPSRPEAAVEELDLTMSLNGTDWHEDDAHSWSVPMPNVAWLRVVQPSGNINSGACALTARCILHVPLLLNASGLEDRSDLQYVVEVTATLGNRVGETHTQKTAMPVRVIVTALVAPDQCSIWIPPLANLTVGDLLTVVFTARDVDGLPLQTPGTGFEPLVAIDGNLSTVDTTQLTMQYTGGPNGGEYSVQSRVRRLGLYTIHFLHNGRLVPHTNVSFSPRCPIGQAPLTDGRCGCAAGLSRDDTGDCQPCALGTYKAAVGGSSCRPCPMDHQTTEATGSISRDACVCSEGFFLVDAHSPNPRCESCSLVGGALCPASSATLQTLTLARGYWRLSDVALESIRCDPIDHPEDGSACLGGSMCVANHDGPLCQVCELSFHYFDKGTRRCEPCSSSRAGWLTALLLGLAVAAAAAIAAVAMHGKADPRLVRLWWLLRRAIASIDGLGPKLKLMIGFYQIVQTIPTVYQVALPEELFVFTRIVDFFALDWLSIPAACVGSFLSRLWLRTMLPIAVVAAVVILSVAAASCGGGGVEGMRRGLLRTLPLVLVTAFALVPSASRAIFASFDCERFQLNAASGTYESYLRSDYAVRCGGAAHEQIASSAVVLVIVWPVGVTALFGLLLHACRHAIHRRHPSPLSRATGFLTREYRVDFFYWELVELVRRLVLTGFMLLINAPGIIWRLVPATLLCLLHLLLLQLVRPYKSSTTSSVAIGCSFFTVTIFFFALLIRIAEALPLELKSVVLGSVSLFTLAATMGVIMCGALALVVFHAVRDVVESRRLPTIRLAASMQPPTLTLGTGQTYHTFVSHIWSTGQDQAATIKRQLCLLLPGVSAFLDVDDLDDISRLEEYIRASQMVIIFLSRGYFASRNCLREVRTAVELKKPLVLVHEADPSKGGATLSQLREECPEELRAYVFDEPSRALIEWHRILDFQRVSMKRLIEKLLLHSPKYAERQELPLLIPGEITARPQRFSAGVLVRVHGQNAGALEVAEALAEHSPQVQVLSEDAGPGAARPTHLMLYLNRVTFSDEDGIVAAAVRQALLVDKTPILLVHETDASAGGVPFSYFFEVTPRDLIDGGLYGTIAVAWQPGKYRGVSICIALNGLGAQNRGTWSSPCSSWRRWMRPSTRPFVRQLEVQPSKLEGHNLQPTPETVKL